MYTPARVHADENSSFPSFSSLGSFLHARSAALQELERAEAIDLPDSPPRLAVSSPGVPMALAMSHPKLLSGHRLRAAFIFFLFSVVLVVDAASSDRRKIRYATEPSGGV